MDGDNRMMERQEPLKLRLPSSVAVVGCGGVGSWTAYFLALAGVKELWLFDTDTISENNLNRIPLPLETVGVKKTQAVAAMIKAVRPNCDVVAMNEFSVLVADAADLRREVEWIVATTDTLASRKMVYAWAMKAEVGYVEAAAEGEQGSATGSPAEWSTPEENNPGYASVPVWVGPCVFAAATAVSHVVHGVDLGDRSIRMGWVQKDPYVGKFEIFDSTKKEREKNDD